MVTSDPSDPDLSPSLKQSRWEKYSGKIILSMSCLYTELSVLGKSRRSIRMSEAVLAMEGWIKESKVKMFSQMGFE